MNEETTTFADELALFLSWPFITVGIVFVCSGVSICQHKPCTLCAVCTFIDINPKYIEQFAELLTHPFYIKL
jgi:hypothetical protein